MIRRQCRPEGASTIGVGYDGFLNSPDLSPDRRVPRVPRVWRDLWCIRKGDRHDSDFPTRFRGALRRICSPVAARRPGLARCGITRHRRSPGVHEG